MCEITIENFKEKFNEIEADFKKAKLFSVDCEFSALTTLKTEIPSLFDTPCERYLKLRKNIDQIIPIQIGITAFSYNAKTNDYFGKTYTFYVKPASFPGISMNFCFQSNTIDFLQLYNFDFNKFVYQGIPFINTIQQENLQRRFRLNEISEVHCDFHQEFEALVTTGHNAIKNWLLTAKENEFLDAKQIFHKYKYNFQILYFAKKNLVERFKNIWINEEFIIYKLSNKEIKILEIQNKLEKELLENIYGFSKIFQLLIRLKKPLIGHNIFYDLMLLVHNLEMHLPYNYNEYKKLINSLFPIVFDTKTLLYELKSDLTIESYKNTTLSGLYEFVKNFGSQVSIKLEGNLENYGKFHDAGWDSYCAGYIFIKLAHAYALKNDTSFSWSTTSGLINSVAHVKNRVNVIRGSTSHICLDGPDPVSRRPPWLVVESTTGKPVNMNQVSTLVSNYGFCEFKKVPLNSNCIIVAVDNFGNAKRLMRNFKDADYRIRKYNHLKHSIVGQIFTITSIGFSVGVLFWIAQNIRIR